jgi:hypothetical protein
VFPWNQSRKIVTRASMAFSIAFHRPRIHADRNNRGAACMARGWLHPGVFLESRVPCGWPMVLLRRRLGRSSSRYRSIGDRYRYRLSVQSGVPFSRSAGRTQFPRRRDGGLREARM